MSRNTFYDAHCHALTLSHPSILAFTQTIRRRGLEEIYSQFTAPNYMITALFFKAGERMRNMLAVMERDVGSIFELMEDDLAGRFAAIGDGEPLLKDGVLDIGGRGYDRLLLCPLIMDFQCATFQPSEGTYYQLPSAKPLAGQVRDVLEGIRAYRRSRPEGFLEIRPFLGVDTRHYSIEELASFLEDSFDGYQRGEAASGAAFAAMRDYDEASPSLSSRTATTRASASRGSRTRGASARPSDGRGRSGRTRDCASTSPTSAPSTRTRSGARPAPSGPTASSGSWWISRRSTRTFPSTAPIPSTTAGWTAISRGGARP